MEILAFCDHCFEEVAFETKDEIITIDLKDVKFSYAAIIPVCVKCRNVLSIPEVNDLNVIRAYKAQKEALETNNK